MLARLGLGGPDELSLLIEELLSFLPDFPGPFQVLQFAGPALLDHGFPPFLPIVLQSLVLLQFRLQLLAPVPLEVGHPLADLVLDRLQFLLLVPLQLAEVLLHLPAPADFPRSLAHLLYITHRIPAYTFLKDCTARSRSSSFSSSMYLWFMRLNEPSMSSLYIDNKNKQADLTHHQPNSRLRF